MINLLTPAEARKLLRMGRRQIYELIKRRESAVVQRGRRYLISESEVERFIRQETIMADEKRRPYLTGRNCGRCLLPFELEEWARRQSHKRGQGDAGERGPDAFSDRSTAGQGGGRA